MSYFHNGRDISTVIQGSDNSLVTLFEPEFGGFPGSTTPMGTPFNKPNDFGFKINGTDLSDFYIAKYVSYTDSVVNGSIPEGVNTIKVTCAGGGGGGGGSGGGFKRTNLYIWPFSPTYDNYWSGHGGGGGGGGFTVRTYNKTDGDFDTNMYYNIDINTNSSGGNHGNAEESPHNNGYGNQGGAGNTGSSVTFTLNGKIANANGGAGGNGGDGGGSGRDFHAPGGAGGSGDYPGIAGNVGTGAYSGTGGTLSNDTAPYTSDLNSGGTGGDRVEGYTNGQPGIAGKYGFCMVYFLY